MSDESNNKRWFNSVLHASDFSAASDTAFSHALAIAVIGRAEFTIIHVGSSGEREIHWSKYPQVRETLIRWGLLAPGASAAEVFDRLGMKVKKIEARDEDPIRAILGYLDRNKADLLVLATEGREGLPRWLKPSIAEPLARQTEIATLFVPQGIEGFVPLDNADISLNRILIPVDDHPDAFAAINVAARWGEILGDAVAISLVHVGDSSRNIEDYGRYADSRGWPLTQIEGSVVDRIIETARRDRADLIVMPTAGHENFLDLLRGSISEQVLRRAPCPILAVPADSV